MAQIFARDQGAGFQNHVRNIMVVGVTGTVGTHIVRALLSEGRLNVTALTRSDSTSTLLSGLAGVQRVDYNSHAALVSAMQGQEALVITANRAAAADFQTRLIDAAVDAGVRYIMPNEWGQDMSDEALRKETMVAERVPEIRGYIETRGKGATHWIALSCSFWYEWSLGGYEERYGFDFASKTLTLFDEGRTRISTTTLPGTGLAVAKVFGLKILPEDEGDTSATLSGFHDRAVLVNSFVVSQWDMFEAVLRVTGGKEADWTIKHEGSKERYQRGREMLKQGDLNGLIIVLYTRVFFPNGGGDFSHKAVNHVLGLPKEDLDEWTKVAVQMAERGEVRRIAKPAK